MSESFSVEVFSRGKTSPVSASTPPKPGPVSKEKTSGDSSDRSLDGMTLLIPSGSIASRSRVYVGCCSSNLLTCISVTALSWMVVSSVPVRNLTTSLLPPSLLPQPAAPRSATPVSPTPPNLRKSLRLTALGICRSLALLAPVQRFTNDVCLVAQAGTLAAPLPIILTDQS